MGWRRHLAWTRCVLALAAVSACCALATQHRPSWTGIGDALPTHPVKDSPHLVLMVNMSEPVEPVEDFLACTFRAHQPSVANIDLDVLVALTGRHSSSKEWAQGVVGLVQDVVSRSMALSPAFYTALPLPSEGGDDIHIEPTFGAARLLSFLDERPGSFSERGTSYDHALILDSHVCALRVGWLDVALAPLLRDPHMLLTGPVLHKDCDPSSRIQGQACRQDSNPSHDQTSGILSLRVSGPGRTLLRHAEQQYGNLPVTDAILAAATDRGLVPRDVVFANPRTLALRDPVDEALFTDAGYYGLEARIALVHAPRRTRVPGPVALAGRLDLRRGQAAIVIILPPAGVPNMQSLLTSTRTSYVRAGFPDKSIAFLACSRQGLIEASSLASFHVLMTSSSSSQAEPCNGGAVLNAAVSLVRAGVHTMLIVGVDAAATGLAGAALSSLTSKDEGRPVFYLHPESGTPMQAPASPFTSPMNVGAMFIKSPPDKVELAGSGLAAWASALIEDRQLTRASLGALLAPTVAVSTLPDQLFAWGGDRRFVTARPHDGARGDKTAIIYSSGFASMSAPGSPPLTDWAATLAFRHRMLGLWHAGPGPICATYSAVSRMPLLLDSIGAVRQAVRRVIDFMAFARKHQLDCAIFPGFVLGGPRGPVVPFDAVLDFEAVRALAGPDLVLYPRFTDMDATGDGFVAFEQRRDGQHRRGGSESDPGAASRPPPAAALFPSTGVPRVTPGVTDAPKLQAGTEAASAQHALPLLARSLVRAIHDEIAGLSRGSHPGVALVCAHDDPRRTASETALLAMDGRLAHLASQLPVLSSGRPVYLTGSAWRQAAGMLVAGAGAAGVRGWAPDFQVLSAADIHVGAGRAAGGTPGRPTSGARARETRCSVAWAPVIDFVVCLAAGATTNLPVIDLRSHLPPPLPPAALVSRLASHVPPDILVKDLAAFSSWWRRAGRPSLLKGTWAHIVLDGVDGGDGAGNTMCGNQQVLLTSLSPPAADIAGAVCADLIFMPEVEVIRAADGPFGGRLPIAGAENLGSSLPWATPRVLPASIGCLLDPAVLLGLTQCLGPARARLDTIPAALRQSGGACAGLPFTREEHPASARVLTSPRFAMAVALLSMASGRMGDEAH